MAERTGVKWSGEEDRVLRKMFNNGKKIGQIADGLGRDRDAVVFRLIRLGIIGYSDTHMPLRHGLSWSNKEIEQVVAEFEAGQSIEEIASNHQRMKNAILYKLVESGVIDTNNRDEVTKYTDDIQSIDDEEPSKIEKYDRGEEMPTGGPKTVDENPSLIGTLTGRNDAIFLKNKYQAELDKTWGTIVEKTRYLQIKSGELIEIWAKVPAIKKNIESHENEKAQLYTNLGNLLKKETDFEDKMWKTTQKGRKIKSITVKQKFKDSDIDEIKYDSMMDYFKQYPEYASKSSFRKILDKIDQKEAGIRQEKEKYSTSISEYNFRLNTFEKDIQQAEDKFDAYEKTKKEAEERLSNTRYNKSVLNNFRSEQAKAEANLDLLHHRVDQYRNTLGIIKREISNNVKKTFVDMEF